MSRCNELFINSSNYVGWYIKDRDGEVVKDAVIGLTVVDSITGDPVSGVTWPQTVGAEDLDLGLYSMVLPDTMIIYRDKEYAGQLDIQSTGSGVLYMETPYKALVKT